MNLVSREAGHTTNLNLKSRMADLGGDEVELELLGDAL